MRSLKFWSDKLTTPVPAVPATIVSPPWTITIDGDDFTIDHRTDGRLSADAAVRTMPLWAPKLLSAAARNIEVSRNEVLGLLSGAPLPKILPISCAPRDERTFIDIWVKTNARDGKPERVPNAQYTRFLRRPHLHQPPAECGWYVAGHSGGRSYFDADEEVVGWTRIAG